MEQSEAKIERFSPDPQKGLTSEQVLQRNEQGLDNKGIDIKTKSIGRIVRDNLCTLFNLLNFVLAVLVISVGSYRNALFIGIIFCNILIGIIQEIRARQVINRLSVISAPKAHVVRNGKRQDIAVQEVVLDDILILSAGNQICADAVVVSGTCEVNESLVTGESDAVYKSPGDPLLSGSYILAGNCRARVERVGRESYAAKITAGAKQIKRPNSQIMRSLNFIIKTISVAIVPVGVLMFLKQFLLLQEGIAPSVVSTVAALIGMIPEGLILLTSIVLAVGVIRLSRKNTLVQELYCIETLARVDVLCLDKTGTITEGNMHVEKVICLGAENQEVERALSGLTKALEDNNPTFRAVAAYAKGECDWKPTFCVPFSPVRKWSGAAFCGKGSYFMGAAEFLLKEVSAALRMEIEKYAAEGNRVLLLCKSKTEISMQQLPSDIIPIALVVVQDTIRKEAPDTLRFFADQGVDIKIISGDNPLTVSKVAQRAGLARAGEYVDASTLTDEQLVRDADRYAVFGRVSPAQKQILVAALKKQGHTVAMTGDGVNDVLALRDADCSIAIAAGSDAARNASQLVLLDSNFSSLYEVVMEGRRAINNIQRSSSLFLVKTIFSFLLSLFFLVIPATYPFVPIQLTLISSLTVGVPSFFLALEPNKERLKGNFLHNILRRALPGGLTIATEILILTAVSFCLGLERLQISTLAVIVTGFAALNVLFRVCRPFCWWRAALFVLMTVGFVGAMLILPGLFYLQSLTLSMWITAAVLCATVPVFMWLYLKGADRIASRVLERMEKRKGKENH